MSRRPTLLREILAYISIYPLLLFILSGSILGCALIFSLSDYLAAPDESPPVTRYRQVALLPAVPVTPTAPQAAESSAQREPRAAAPTPVSAPSTTEPASNPVAEQANPASPAEEQPEQAAPIAGPVNVDENTPAAPSPAPTQPPQDSAAVAQSAAPSPTSTPTLDLALPPLDGSDPTATATRPRRRPTATPTPTEENLLQGLMTDLMSLNATPTPTGRRVAALPTLTPTPTPTATATPTETPSPTPTPTVTPLPTNTPPPTAPPPPSPTSPPTNTPVPTNTPRPTAVPAPTNTPLPSPTPTPDYPFMLAEFFNSPTTNSFMVMYVAIVDAKEIPIGDLKVVGTRLDHNLTYESPLSKWHFEGYNAPGQVIKSGNTKFEPPGGIETTSWLVHLEDDKGNRLSPDVPFDTNENDKQWYFVKFKRKF